MIDLKLDKILSFLKSQGFDAQIQEQTHQIYFVYRIHHKEFPVFIRVFDAQSMLQMLIFMPCALTPEGVNDTARLLHLLNKELDIPGFGMDENAGALFYRLNIPFFSGKIEKNHLLGFLASLKELSQALYPAIELAATGHCTLEEILKQAEERRT